MPRKLRLEYPGATKQLVPLYDPVNELFKKRLEGLAGQFKESQPSFYNAYLSARRIVNIRGGRVSKPAPNVVVPLSTASIGAPLTIAKAA